MTSILKSSNLDSPDIAFLKVATAAPDFENLDIEGIPDDFSGPTFVKKDFIYTTLSALPGEVTYIVVAPTQGVAYYYASKPLLSGYMPPASTYGGLLLQGAPFPDASSLYPGVNNFSSLKIDNTVNVVRGRLLGQSAEIVALNNPFHQFGSITTFKTPLNRSIIEDVGLGAPVRYHITGAAAMVQPTVFASANIAPIRDGSYAVSMSRESQFNFADVLDDVAMTTPFPAYTTNAGPPTDPQGEATFKGPAVVWDNGFDSIIFRIMVPPNVDSQSFILKVYKTWELQPAANSLAASIAHSSPPSDPRAIAMYHQIARELPVSVPAKDNPDFWNRVIEGLHSVSGVLSNVPIIAPYAKGINTLTTLGRNLRRRKKTAPPKKAPKTTRPAKRKPKRKGKRR